jgi:hypothetical protein
MKKIRWALFNGIFAVCVYFGVIEQKENVLNVALFFAWAISFLSLFTISDTFKNEMMKKVEKEGYSVPEYVDIVFDLIITATFAWGGYFWTAAVYFLHLFLISASRTDIQNELSN